MQTSPSDTTIDVSVVIAIYNDGTCAPELALRTITALAACTVSFELILVDDGSTDDTAAILRHLEADEPRIRVFELNRNFGQATALACGLFAAAGERVVTMDGDLQNPPEEIPRLLATFAAGAAIATGRRERRYEGVPRWLGSRAIHWMARYLTGVKLDDYGGNFKAYRRDVVEATRRVWAPGKPLFPLALRLGFPVAEVTVRHLPRYSGSSRYTFARLLRVNLELITAFTTLPLTLLGIIGAGALFAGVGGLSFWALFLGDGWLVPAVSLTAIGCGSVFAASGILGLYLGRVYELVSSGGPGYIVRSGPSREPPADDEGAATTRYMRAPIRSHWTAPSFQQMPIVAGSKERSG